jgi:alkanesulfonate monooxygenase SsuD/methylene tetrahydromethanopterin reductase-like flavin-dependent oxidoreductase (luciferase family)
MRWLVVLALCAACKRDAPPPPPPAPNPPNPAMPASEAKRARDACRAYVDKVCACAEKLPALKQECSVAGAYPDAIQVDLEVAATADTSRRDARQTQQSVRAIVKQCIEAAARLPAAGCP